MRSIRKKLTVIAVFAAVGCSGAELEIDPLDPASAPEEVWSEGVEIVLEPPPGEVWPESPEQWADESELTIIDDEFGTTASGLSVGVFQVPFPCGQVWAGQTRTNHSPVNSIDFNRANDLGDKVVASAGGRVSVVGNTGSTSYGRWVEIDHGDGYRTRYAHLSSVAVRTGQSVARGQKIGAVGSTGGSTGPHLHFELRRNGVALRPVFNGERAFFFGTRNYRSVNRCNVSPSGASGTVRTSGAALTVRAGPGTSFRAVRTKANGSRVSIVCHKRGERVSGTYGTSRLWDRLAKGGFVSDAFVYTGSDGRVAPWCD